MKEFNDVQLTELISAGREATRELSSLKFKSAMPRIKELRVFRRSRFEMIRKRATQLNLTATDLNLIHAFIQMKDN
jgi:hypothetical protein